MKNNTVYCLMNVCSCFVMVLKFHIFSITHSRRRRGVVMVRRLAILLMCYIVRKITTRGVPQSYASYLRTSQPLDIYDLWPLVTLQFYASTVFA